MGALGRVELPTNGLGNRCSIHLSYRASWSTHYRMATSERLGLSACQGTLQCAMRPAILAVSSRETTYRQVVGETG